MSSMANLSRVFTTTILGVVFGAICMLLSEYSLQVPFWPMGISLLLHHTVMGFAIGASALKINWAAHGILWGVLFSIFLSISFVGRFDEFWVAALIFPIIWAFLIEVFTTKVFKQPQ
ncbi:MAG: hypothetical protein H3Z52_01480 [archaeon]|nr:hypothetical protein [archaeon]